MVPVYVAEVSPAHLRGQLVTVNTLFISAGVRKRMQSELIDCWTRRAFWVRPRCSSHRGDSGRKRKPTNWTTAGTAERPNIGSRAVADADLRPDPSCSAALVCLLD
ncbi:hypothetical protein CRUP_033010 [Coryphaenoides rupestris]|nr:hypothetical protein CRUP_033010 [Coryphaenoides rupestris]